MVLAVTEAKSGVVARWGLLCVSLLLSLGLVIATVKHYYDVRELEATLARGQVEAFLRTVRERVPPIPGLANEEILQGIVDHHRSAGLRYVAFLDPQGSVLVSAGEPIMEGPLPEPDVLEIVGDRARLRAPPPPGPPLPFDMRPPTVLLELEALAANTLLTRARQGIIASFVVAIVLMLAATVLWRVRARADRAEADLTRQRHLAALGEMSAVLAHEIRNPLAAAKGHSQLLAEQLPGGHDGRARADLVVEHIVRLEALVTQLLDFARSTELDRVDTSPVELLEEASRGVDGLERIAMETSDAPPSWSLDPTRMGQVMSNLLRNALEASPADGTVEVAVGVDDRQLVLSVRDRGEGIAPGELGRIFEPFHTTRVRGTGLGLAIAQRIVQLHGGSIEARNHPEGGAIFRVNIPRG